MRYVELRRHTDNDGDELTAEGMEAAEAIGRDGLRPPYAAFVSTGAHRATQMLRTLRDAAGQEDIPVIEDPTLRSDVEDRWRAAAKAAGKGASVGEMREVDLDLVDSEAGLLGAALRAVVDALPEDGRALVVGHSPTNEAAVLGLTGDVIAPMGKGEGVLLVEDDGQCRVEPLP